jgi:thiamine transporter ThiT
MHYRRRFGFFNGFKTGFFAGLVIGVSALILIARY